MKNKIRFWLMGCLMAGYSGAVSAQSLDLIGILSQGNERRLYVKLDCGDKELDKLQLVGFSMNTGQNLVQSEEPVSAAASYLYFPVGDECFDAPAAYRVRALFTDGTMLRTEQIEVLTEERFFWLGSDVTWSSAGSGYKLPVFDSGVEHPLPLYVDGTGFYKCISTHANGFFEFNFPADNPYKRLVTHYGIQDDRSWGKVSFSFKVNNVLLEEWMMYAKTNTAEGATGPYLRTFETPVEGATLIRLEGDIAGSSSSDHMNYPLARVYLKDDARQPQESDWEGEQILSEYAAFTHTLDASFSSGGEVVYRLVAGAEYATLQGDQLQVHTIPSDKSTYLEVEAFQPGTDGYSPSDVYRRRFFIRNEKVVQKDEQLLIAQGEVVDELTVYGDATSVGQIQVEGGVPRIKRLVIKYTFEPGSWNFISFPANLNLDTASNLGELGYRLNMNPKPYYICEYDTRKRAENPSVKAWNYLLSPVVRAGKGYLMGVARTADGPNEPVEVTFVIDNAELEVTAEQNALSNVMLDFTQVTPGETISLYVKPEGVKGNTLRVDIKFDPDDLSKLPLDYGKALEEARITFNPNRSGIRLTLPTDDPAKVLIFDAKGELVKAVRYVSPYLIDVKSLTPGTYSLLVEYGAHRAWKQFEIF